MGDLVPSIVRSTFASDVVNISSEYYEYKTDEELASVVLFRDYPEGLLKFASACCILFMLVGIPGNLITIVALARCKKVRYFVSYSNFSAIIYVKQCRKKVFQECLKMKIKLLSY